MAARIGCGFRTLLRCELGGQWFRTCSRSHTIRRLTTFPISTLRASPSFILKGRSTILISSLKQRPHLIVCRASSSSSGGDEGEGGEEKPAGEGQESAEGDGSLGLITPIVKQYALAPVSIPERFPEVPVLPISRHPIFPRFVKMLEVCLHGKINFEQPMNCHWLLICIFFTCMCEV